MFSVCVCVCVLGSKCLTFFLRDDFESLKCCLDPWLSCMLDCIHIYVFPFLCFKATSIDPWYLSTPPRSTEIPLHAFHFSLFWFFFFFFFPLCPWHLIFLFLVGLWFLVLLVPSILVFCQSLVKSFGYLCPLTIVSKRGIILRIECHSLEGSNRLRGRTSC